MNFFFIHIFIFILLKKLFTKFNDEKRIFKNLGTKKLLVIQIVFYYYPKLKNKYVCVWSHVRGRYRYHMSVDSWTDATSMFSYNRFSKLKSKNTFLYIVPFCPSLPFRKYNSVLNKPVRRQSNLTNGPWYLPKNPYITVNFSLFL